MKYFVIAFLCLLVSCSGPKVEPEVDSGKSLFQILAEVSCPNASDFRVEHISSSESEALAGARSNMALEHFSKKLESEIQINAQNINQVATSSTKMNIGQEATMINPQDAKLHYSTRHGTQVGVVVCMSRADAAKGFIERQRPVASSLEFAANAILETKHPKLKSEAWQRAKPLWDEFTKNQAMIEGLDKAAAAVFEPLKAMYAKAKEDYLGYCQTAKLYWNPEHNDFYSEKAFAKLSKSSKLEKASCRGNGVSLVYRNSGHKCEQAGIFKCYHKPSLLVASCYGEEYRILESPNVEVFQKREDVALEKLREKLEYESFWSDWEKEIKQWSPQCE